MYLQNDSRVDSYDGKMEYVWNGRISKDGDSGGVGLHTGTGTKDGPAVFTFDLGVLAKLSRFALWAIQDEKHFYNDMERDATKYGDALRNLTPTVAGISG